MNKENPPNKKNADRPPHLLGESSCSHQESFSYELLQPSEQVNPLPCQSVGGGFGIGVGFGLGSGTQADRQTQMGLGGFQFWTGGFLITPGGCGIRARFSTKRAQH